MFKHCFQVIWSIWNWVQREGLHECLNHGFSTQARCYIIALASDWSTCSSLILDANWLKITITSREHPDSACALNVLRLPGSLRLSYFHNGHSLVIPYDTLPHQSKSCLHEI